MGWRITMSHVLSYVNSYSGRGFVLDPYQFKNNEASIAYDKYKNSYYKKCPYCASKITEVLKLSGVDNYNETEKHHHCNGCFNCGWWYYERNDMDGPWMPGHQIRQIASLKKFNVSSDQLPLEALKLELLKRPKIIYDIHHKKFEELVADVLKDFLNVEVNIIGKRGDGGIDLVYINGDNPFAVQVKRRQRPEKTETVKIIREFLGAMVIEGYRFGSIITTAERFSHGSKKLKERIENNNIVNKFELIDSNKFFEMLKFNQKDGSKYPWEKIFLDLLQMWHKPNERDDVDIKIKYKGFRTFKG